MADDRLRAEFHEPPAPQRMGARPTWMGFLGGAVVLVLAILVAVGIRHIAESRTATLTVAELTEIETLLNDLGFPPGAVDGVLDEQSVDAIGDFQVTAGLKVDGTPSPALLDELRAAKAELGGN